MIYLIYGTDKDKARKKAWEIVDSLLAKKKDAVFSKFTEEDEITQSHLDELVGGQALFVNKFIILFHEVFENAETKSLITKNIKEIAGSDNIFILLEEKVDAKTLEKISKVSVKNQEFEKKDMTKKEKLAEIGEKIDFFEFADALGSRDKKVLWRLYQDALIEVVPAEEVHGIFYWQVKSMLLALKCASAEDAKMKPYPFQKSKAFAKKYKQVELEKMSSNLVSMYHEAHRGKIDFYIALEKFILSL
jgi:hypothetical protein